MPHPFKLFRINQTYRNINRLRQIITVFAKHGFYRFLDEMNLTSIIPILKRINKAERKEVEVSAIPRRIRLVFEELGPTFIKLGQMLSTRQDLIPDEYVNEFKKLQDEVPPFDIKTVKETIEDELKYPCDVLFDTFDDEPIAAASIAQVHRATLSDGTKLIAKVQRPRIEKTTETDISILFTLAGLVARYIPALEWYNPVGIVEEFSRSMRKELDFIIEAANAERMARYFEDDPKLKVPKVYWEYTTKRVLIMEYIEGISIGDIPRLKSEGYDMGLIAKNSVNIFLKQVLVHGFFHGDLHPGNILILKDNRIALIDFGIVGRINKKMMESFATIFISLLREDYEAIAEEYVEMGLFTGSVDLEEFKRDIRDVVEPYYGRPLKDVKSGELMLETIRVGMKHGIKVQKEFLLLSRSSMTLEGVARQIDPEFNLLEEGKPFIKSLLVQRFSPARVTNDVYKAVKELTQFSAIFPRQLKILLKKMITDNFSIEFNHKGLEDLIGELDRASNRLSFSMVISALIIGSSVVMFLSKGPLYAGLSILGIIGYCLAGLFALVLAFLIIRSGKF